MSTVCSVHWRRMPYAGARDAEVSRRTRRPPGYADEALCFLPCVAEPQPNTV